MSYTPIDEISKIRDAVKAGFRSGKLRPVAYRKKQLLGLAYMLKDNRSRFVEALKTDLGRPPLESNFLEIDIVISEVVDVYHEVEKWAKPEKPAFDLTTFAMSPVIRKEPQGVVLIIGPFNFPLFCVIGPMIGAIAAGNAVVIKPSELNVATSALVAELLPQYLDQSLFRVVTGAIPETTKLLELQWDHILYTGSGRVGRIVAAAAAKHLTPVTLELGGKNPAVIDSNCDVQFAARRLLWGKTANAGQICAATDYVLVQRDFQDKFVDALVTEYKAFYPEGAANSKSFSRLATSTHYERVKKMLDGTQGKIVIGGETNAQDKFIAPTIIRDVSLSDSLMSDEIFGPLLPIVPVSDIDEAISIINARDHPLALYVFTQDSKFKSKVFDSTQSGAAVANETVLHVGINGLPFGGTGSSGYGHHTGKYSFDLFTHKRSSMDSPKFLDLAMKARYPPYTAGKLKFLSRLLGKKLPPRDGSSGNKLYLIFVFIAAAIGTLTGTEWGRGVVQQLRK